MQESCGRNRNIREQNRQNSKRWCRNVERTKIPLPLPTVFHRFIGGPPQLLYIVSVLHSLCLSEAPDRVMCCCCCAGWCYYAGCLHWLLMMQPFPDADFREVLISVYDGFVLNRKIIIIHCTNLLTLEKKKHVTMRCFVFSIVCFSCFQVNVNVSQ